MYINVYLRAAVRATRTRHFHGCQDVYTHYYTRATDVLENIKSVQCIFTSNVVARPLALGLPLA